MPGDAGTTVGRLAEHLQHPPGDRGLQRGMPARSTAWVRQHHQALGARRRIGTAEDGDATLAYAGQLAHRQLQLMG